MITEIIINGISVTQEHGHLLLQKDGIQNALRFWRIERVHTGV